MRRRLETAVVVREPLVLISQIQRSGGTLLSQLLDAHPECHVHPYEVKVGSPTKFDWPELDVEDSPKTWFKTLREGDVERHFVDGYTKFTPAAMEGSTAEQQFDRFPFLLAPRLQRELFLALARQHGVASERDIFDYYFMSYFNAWLDNQNLYHQPKKFVAGFTPRLAISNHNRERFFTVYPDGVLVMIVREPKSWFVSARRHQPREYGDVDIAMSLWKESADAALAARDRYRDRVVVVVYDRLVEETEAELRRLAGRLGISFVSSLLEPTFNGRPIRADSSFPVSDYGVIKEPVERRAGMLDASLALEIDRRARPTYERVLALP